MLSLLRILGSFGLLVFAFQLAPYWFVGLYLILGFTDLIDGPIARWLKQESVHGAKLDSIADVLLSGCLLCGVVILRWAEIRPEAIWIGVAIFSYAVALGFTFFKFRRFPSFHTYSAKVNHFLVAIAGVLLVVFGWVWPLQIVCLTTCLTNLEVLLIAIYIENYRTNVGSIFRLKRKPALSSETQRQK